jgi:catechol 2,3-dioxygenase-like lactoylglutathione lyase family enzyme
MTGVYHRGRLIDHVHLRVCDLDAAKSFYRAVLAALGREPTCESGEAIGFDELWIDTADRAGASRVHLAFQAEDHDAVKRFHAAGPKPADAMTARPASANITPATTPPFRSALTASRPCFTGQ